MAYNLAITELSDIFMSSNDPLDQDPMNRRFDVLRKNDILINNLFSNSIGIWECSWYYDSSIKGYSIGDAVWINTEDPDEFVKSRAVLIKHYTDFNSQILNKLPDFDPKDDTIVNQYKDAMSGYTDVNLGKNVVLPPIFDIGDFSKPIQIAISLKNNNKGLLTDQKSWKKLFVDSDEDEKKIRKIIDEKENFTLERHLHDYHLSGQEETVKAKLSDYINVPTNTLYYTTFPSGWQSNYDENRTLPNYGTDYVKYRIRKPYTLNEKISQYQCVRYWNSGMIEHYGIIATNNEMFVHQDKNEFWIPFNWKIANDESGAKAYESGELAKSLTELLSANETHTNMIPPKDNFINVLFQKSSVIIDGLQRARAFKNGNYNISIHPVYQDQIGIVDNYLPITYGEETFMQNWNSNYLTNEVIRAKDRNKCILRLGTRVLPPYISYYAVGKGDF